MNQKDLVLIDIQKINNDFIYRQKKKEDKFEIIFTEIITKICELNKEDIDMDEFVKLLHECDNNASIIYIIDYSITDETISTPYSLGILDYQAVHFIDTTIF